MMRSLQGRLSVGLLIILVFAFLVQWLFAHRALEYVLKSYAVSRLEQDVEWLLAGLRKNTHGDLELDPAHSLPKYTRPLSGDYFRIVTQGAVIRSRSLWDAELAMPALRPGAKQRWEVAGPATQPLLLVARGYTKFDQDVVIAVGTNIAPLIADLRTFRWQYGVLSFAVLGVLMALHAWGVRRGLQPLKTIRAELIALEKGEIQRLNTTHAPREVQPLVEQINRLLSVLMQRVERSRHAMGNLAHALKTPLAALMSRLDRPELKSHRELQQELLRHTQTVRELIERELKRARVVGAAIPTGRYDLALELDALVQTLRSVYRDKALSLSVEAPAASDCPLDREDLHELLGNLLDNACKWARTQVTLRVVSGTPWQFTVEDDGPGVSESELNTITGRGVRIDESSAGHGLGLAIVSDLLEQYRGNLLFDASPSLGGLRVVAQVPRSA